MKATAVTDRAVGDSVSRKRPRATRIHPDSPIATVAATGELSEEAHGAPQSQARRKN